MVILISNTQKESTMSKVTVKGQVTIPKSVRDDLGIQAGTDVEFVKQGNYFILVKKAKRKATDYLEKWKGALTTSDAKKGVDELVHDLRGGRDRR
jgi:AbrB family looped-hinge helix DNA binding protein